jgi:hypothetical protein
MNGGVWSQSKRMRVPQRETRATADILLSLKANKEMFEQNLNVSFL